MLIDQLTALALAASAFFLILRQLLLSDQGFSFPQAPFAVQVAMFVLGAVQLGVAVMFIGHNRHPYAGDAAGAVLALAVVATLYNVVMFRNILRHRRHREVGGPFPFCASPRPCDQAVARTF